MTSKKQNIKAVTFDLWETLLLEKDGASARRTTVRCKNLSKALNKFGVQLSVEQIDSALKKTTSQLVELWEVNKDISHLEQLKLIVKNASDGSVTMKKEWVNELTSAYIDPVLKVRPYLNPDAPKVLKNLKKQNKLIGLICNTGLTPGISLRRLLATEDVARYFDLMVFSEEVGIRKPDARIFHLVSDKLKVRPGEIVHVGDNLKVDVWGAKNAGFKAIHFSNEEGRDKIAESDPNSLVAISRRLGGLKKEQLVPDKEIGSLTMTMKAIEELENRT